MTYFEIEPAKAKKKDPTELWDHPYYVAEEKLDGWRFLMHFGRELERTYMTGRRTSIVTGFLSEKGLCAPCLWPQNIEIGYTVLDGEVLTPEKGNFRDIAGIMNTTPEKAAQSMSRLGPPSYAAFDLLWFDNRDLRNEPYLIRRRELTCLINSLQNPLISLVPSHDNKQALYDMVIDHGGEGVILKDIGAPYGEGWIKVKRFHTLDVIITGFTDAKMGITGKYLGLIGAAIVSVYDQRGILVQVGRVSGMTDDIRRDMSTNPDRWLGSVIEIYAQEFGKDRLRHPRFKRHRQDADPKNATLEKMMRDLNGVFPSLNGKQMGFEF